MRACSISDVKTFCQVYSHAIDLRSTRGSGCLHNTRDAQEAMRRTFARCSHIPVFGLRYLSRCVDARTLQREPRATNPAAAHVRAAHRGPRKEGHFELLREVVLGTHPYVMIHRRSKSTCLKLCTGGTGIAKPSINSGRKALATDLRFPMLAMGPFSVAKRGQCWLLLKLCQGST